MYSRKQEEFSGLISQQPKPRYIFLEMNLGRLSHPRRCHRSRGSLNNHCSNTPDTSGVKPNIKKEFFTCFVIGGKPTNGKTKGILLRKLIFPPSTCVKCYFAEIGGT